MEIHLHGTHNDKKILVSSEDYERVKQFKWYKMKNGCISGSVNKIPILLHHFIMNTEKGQLVDHINRNPFDNRRENLRIYSLQLNAKNRSISKTKSSNYRGVFYVKERKKYVAKFKYDKKVRHIGTFLSEVEAAEAVDMYIIHNKLEGMELNFPDKRKEYLEKEYTIHNSKQYCSSVYNGISYAVSDNKYRAVVTYNKKNIYVCSSIDELVCARAYDKYIVENNIPEKKLNFPDEHPNYNKHSIIKTECEEIDENTVKLLINNTNLLVTIDKEDYDKIKNYNCYVVEGYVKLTIESNSIPLHRFLMNAIDPKEFIDHINSNTLDNTKKKFKKIKY